MFMIRPSRWMRSMTDSHGQIRTLVTLSSVRSRRHSFHSQADGAVSILVTAPHAKSFAAEPHSTILAPWKSMFRPTSGPLWATDSRRHCAGPGPDLRRRTGTLTRWSGSAPAIREIRSHAVSVGGWPVGQFQRRGDARGRDRADRPAVLASRGAYAWNASAGVGQGVETFAVAGRGRLESALREFADADFWPGP